MEASIKKLFTSFIEDRCTADEKLQVLTYISSGGYEEEWEAAMKDAEASAQTGHQLPYNFNEAELYQKIKQKGGIPTAKIINIRWLAYAASLLLLGTAGIFFFKSRAKIQAPQTAQKVAMLPQIDNGRKWIKLPDGTSVQLNSNSHLNYPDSFKGKKTREVTLSGEAFFDVKHDAKHAFIIHTGAVTTTVLGTAFNISAYKANKSVTVTVTRGRVMVQAARQTLAYLAPNQQLVWTAGSKPGSKHEVDAGAVVAWKASDLIMDDITLAEAADMITKRYGVKMVFKNDKVKGCRFTAAFLNRNDLAQVISVLSDITGARLVLRDGVVAIDGAGC